MDAGLASILLSLYAFLRAVLKRYLKVFASVLGLKSVIVFEHVDGTSNMLTFLHQPSYRPTIASGIRSRNSHLRRGWDVQLSIGVAQWSTPIINDRSGKGC